MARKSLSSVPAPMPDTWPLENAARRAVYTMNLIADAIGEAFDAVERSADEGVIHLHELGTQSSVWFDALSAEAKRLNATLAEWLDESVPKGD